MWRTLFAFGRRLSSLIATLHLLLLPTTLLSTTSNRRSSSRRTTGYFLPLGVVDALSISQNHYSLHHHHHYLVPSRRHQQQRQFLLPLPATPRNHYAGHQHCVKNGPKLQFCYHSSSEAVATRDAHNNDVVLLAHSTTVDEHLEESPVPSTLSQALRIFFLGPFHGPRLVCLAISSLSAWRLCLAAPMTLSMDGLTVCTMLVLWWLQEHFMHERLLHSSWDWYGKDIHAEHHAKPYHNISIDPAWLMLTWLGTVHVLLRALLPLPIALSATVGYAAAGLFYEWAHYIVHTKVPFRGSNIFARYWRSAKNHHARHHCIDSRYWLAFSIPAVDDWFGTSPTVQQVRQQQKQQAF